MSAIEACQLTIKDHLILEVMLERRLGRSDPIIPVLRQKLAKAVVVFGEEIDAHVVTLNSRVLFRVDDGHPDARIVVQGDESLFPGLTLPITTLRGLALLGLKEGQSISLPRSDGSIETIRVERVAYQPEAARREALARHLRSVGDLGSKSQMRPQIVSLTARRQRKASLSGPEPYDDDPGSAAA